MKNATSIICAALGLLLTCVPSIAMATEQPKYKLIEKSGDIELRLYPPMVVAETWVEGSMDQAMNRGFGLIAGYIFGKNIERNGKRSEKIAMTSPVTVDAGSQKIAMTTPVTMESAEGRWRVYFIMPAEYTLATLPTPTDPRVSLREVPAQHMAAITFAGFAGEDKVQEKTSALVAALSKRGLKPSSTPRLARYDPPWTLPFLRRNEVLVTYQ